MRRVLTRLQKFLWIGGVCALGYCAFSLWTAHSFQAEQARKFDLQRKNSREVGESTPERSIPATKNGEVMGKLMIPRLGVKVMVVEGVDEHDLRLGAGHIPETVMPYQHGNAGIAGHRDTVFRPLRNIRKNDLIELATYQGTYTYRVVRTEIVDPDNVGVLKTTPEDSLTLVTCYPFYFVGSAPRRFIVQADKVKPDKIAAVERTTASYEIPAGAP